MIMTKEQQDLAWACLPKEAREELKRAYKYQCQNPDYNRGFNEALEEVFNSHNLTTDSEPEEMLMVERNKVQESHNHYQKTWDEDHSNEWANGICFILEDLFGDKCLPDKELNEANFTKSDSSQSSDSSHNDHPQPKFNKGNKVIFYKDNPFLTDIIAEIVRYDDSDASYFIEIPGIGGYWVKEFQIKPYTEPILSSGDPSKSDQEIEKESGKEDNFHTNHLNLCEILKDCPLDEPLFSLTLGPVTFYELQPDRDRPVRIKYEDRIYGVLPNGNRNEHGLADLYPSEELLRKHPLDARAAWMEWKESRKPKFIVQAQIRLISNQGKTIDDYECVEVEVSEIDLTKAADGIRQYLQNFKNKNANK